MRKGVADSKKAKRPSKEEIKKQWSESMIIGEVVESEDLNKEAEEIREPEEAVKVIKRYEDIIKMKEKGIISVAYYQGKVFKRFKEKEKFVKLVSELGIHKNTIIFKINVFKLCKKYPKLLRSSKGLRFFKNYHKDIKAVCEESQEVFDNFWAFLSFEIKPVTQVFISDIQVKYASLSMHSFSFEYVFILVCKNFWVVCL